MAYARQVRIVIVITIMIVVGGRVGPSDRVLRVLGGGGGGVLSSFVFGFRVARGGRGGAPINLAVLLLHRSTAPLPGPLLRMLAGWEGGAASRIHPI